MKNNNFVYLFCLLFLVSAQFTLASEQEESAQVTVEDFFRKAVISNASMSPSGNSVVYEKFNEVMFSRGNEKASSIFNVSREFYISNFYWSSENVIVAKTVRRNDGMHRFYAFKIKQNENGVELEKYKVIDEQAYVVDPLFGNEDRIFLARYKRTDTNLYTDVFNVNLFERNSFKKRHRINRDSEDIVTWLTDSSHKLAIGISYRQGVPSIWARKNNSKRLKMVWTAQRKSEVYPIEISKDGKKLWLITDAVNDTKSAVQFDLESFSITKKLFEIDGKDITDILIDNKSDKPFAVSYLEDGLLTYQFLDEADKKKFSSFMSVVKDKVFHIIDATESFDKLLTVATSQSNPGQLLLCEINSTDCSEVGDLFPWLKSVKLAKTQSFKTLSDDGLEIESYITLPNSEEQNIPVIVMPHGGPIGVRDSSYFSGDPQWLAYNGYAVLQVNYRGSAGFGRQFKFKGMQQWGRSIEDDIEAALANALKKYPQINEQKICLFGSSYGGYSAIMGIIRAPEQYSCAVSFAGVTDLPLLFNKSSVKNDLELTTTLKEIVGDPTKNVELLMQYSPVYQYHNITKPLMLVHGSTDERVDIEHSWRLKTLLELADIPVDFFKMNNVGHSFKTTGEIKQLYDYIMPFLEKHLSEPAKQVAVTTGNQN
ncbi:S9 family peptidase [Thalassotalea sp. M1531]|uniref:S9 family peptidase n=1 Tax=Thalassotalea algicola TaxID=2716224 RepID=A0A7Y0Q7J8_9GAMM|nr:prolyl oligopeptidase family serine peptidase [Thalassotalea algicola]NMP31967.1 S9 family peptidase [Thalassotalea algicola]